MLSSNKFLNTEQDEWKLPGGQTQTRLPTILSMHITKPFPHVNVLFNLSLPGLNNAR